MVLFPLTSFQIALLKSLTTIAFLCWLRAPFLICNRSKRRYIKAKWESRVVLWEKLERYAAVESQFFGRGFFRSFFSRARFWRDAFVLSAKCAVLTSELGEEARNIFVRYRFAYVEWFMSPRVFPASTCERLVRGAMRARRLKATRARIPIAHTYIHTSIYICVALHSIFRHTSPVIRDRFPRARNAHDICCTGSVKSRKFYCMRVVTSRISVFLKFLKFACG